MSSRSRSKRSKKNAAATKLWVTNIEKDTLKNSNWRRVYPRGTSSRLQVVLMSVPPGEELGWEKHAESDQFFRVEGGHALIETDDEARELDDGMVTIIPRGTWHNVVNLSSRSPLQMYTIYGPPHHKPGTIDRTHEAERKREKRQ